MKTPAEFAILGKIMNAENGISLPLYLDPYQELTLTIQEEAGPMNKSKKLTKGARSNFQEQALNMIGGAISETQAAATSVKSNIWKAKEETNIFLSHETQALHDRLKIIERVLFVECTCVLVLTINLLVSLFK